MPTPPEADEKRDRAALYSRAAATYGEAQGLPFAHAGRRLVELAGVGRGQRVLDVGAGRGAVLFPATERVGPTGFVLGVDFSAAMVAHTQVAIRERGLGQAQMVEFDVEWLSPDALAAHFAGVAAHGRSGRAAAPFDFVLCSF